MSDTTPEKRLVDSVSPSASNGSNTSNPLNNSSPQPLKSNESDKKPKVTRRSVACKSCHSLKVKCTPSDPNNPSAPCVRCINANRICEIDLNQTRKRRKKSEILEAKRQAGQSLPEHKKEKNTPTQSGYNSSENYSSSINNANDSLLTSRYQSPMTFDPTSPMVFRPQASSAVPPIPSNLNPQSAAPTPIPTSGIPPQLPSPHESAILRGNTTSPTSKDDEINQLKQRVRFLETELANKRLLANKKGFSNDSPTDLQSPPFVSKFDLESEISILAESSARLTDLTNQLNEAASRRIQLVSAKKPVDLISKGVITVAEAEERLKLYREQIYGRHPLIAIPDNMHAIEFLQSQPFLFNSIMSACNLITKNADKDVVLAIDNEAMTSVAVEVMVVGTKSVELVKAFLVLCLYYNSPELFKQRRYHMLNTICVSLLHDVGIFARPTYSYNQADGTLKQDANSKDKGNDEYRELVLITYFVTVSTCLVLRRSIYARWTPYVEECCSLLENSLQEKHRRLALFARMNNKLDKIHHIVHAPEMPGQKSGVSQYVIQELQRLLSDLKLKIKDNQYSLLSYYYSIEAYLHEPILTKVFKSDTELDGKAMKSIRYCTSSCLNALDEYSKLTPDQIALLPFPFGSRIMYTAGMLLRLRYLILSLPSHIDKELVPKRAVTSIQCVSKLVEQANILNPHNHYLTKMRLVLQLFIQTYATQVLELLSKNGNTPQNFKPDESETQQLRALAREYNDIRKVSKVSLVSDTRSAEPLDVLSYAATFRRENNDKPSAVAGSLRKSFSENDQAIKTSSQCGQFVSANNTPVPQVINSPPILQTNVPVLHQSQSIINGNNRNSAPLAFNNITTPSLHQFGDVLPPSSMPQPDYRQFRLPSISNTVHYSSNPRLNANLANPDQLENSYQVLNDEFWSNLLSTDSTDRINFTSNNFNGNTGNDEVFFMNN